MGSWHELNPSWLPKVRPGLSFSEVSGPRLSRPKLKPRSPDFDSVAPLRKVPRTKYWKILVLIGYPRQPALGYQKAFATWVLYGDAETEEMGWMFVEHLFSVNLV